MKKLVLLAALSVSMSSVFANNLFPTNNPFPETEPQTMNNIYESEPAKIQQEAKQQKKSWFKKGKNLQEEEAREMQQSGLNTYPVNEGVNNGSFYMFK